MSKFEEKQELIHDRERNKIQKLNVALYSTIAQYLEQFANKDNKVDKTTFLNKRKEINAFIDKQFNEQYKEYKEILKAHYTDVIDQNILYELWLKDREIKPDQNFKPEKVNHTDMIEDDQTGIPLNDRINKNRDENKFKTKQVVATAVLAGITITNINKRLKKSIETNSNSQTRLFSTKDNDLRNESKDVAGELVEKYGYMLEKEWVATLDKRTRTNHRKLDGQRKPLKKNFKVKGAYGQRPGQMNKASENINCRCRIRFHTKKNKNGEYIRTFRPRGVGKSTRTNYKTYAEYYEVYKSYL